MAVRRELPLEVQEYRRAHVPLFRDHFRLALFGMNVKGAQCISTAPGVNDPTWNGNLRLARLADRAGIEALIPICRWIGFGGPSNFHGSNFETFTWAAGLAAVTKYSMIVATSHVPAIHPIVAAKQTATIDHISRGRFALNLVSGWFEDEMACFGVKMLEHDRRYDQAAEWLELARQLWTRDGVFDFEGEFYQSHQVSALPKPIQKPYPPIINAAASPRGRQFTAQYADIFFTTSEDLQHLGEVVRDMRRLAWEEHQREIVIIGSVVVTCGATEQEARDYRRLIVEQGDWEAARNNRAISAKHSRTFSWDHFQRFPDKYFASYGCPEVVGTPEQVADYFVQLSRLGLDGVSFSFMGHWEANLRRMTKEVIPLLVQAGLRREHRPKRAAAT